MVTAHELAKASVFLNQLHIGCEILVFFLQNDGNKEDSFHDIVCMKAPSCRILFSPAHNFGMRSGSSQSFYCGLREWAPSDLLVRDILVCVSGEGP
jgi:hypothetical protein